LSIKFLVLKNIISQLLNKNCNEDNIKCKSFNTITVVVSIVAFTAFIAMYIKNIYFQVDDFFLDVGRLLFVSIFAGLAYILHKRGLKILPKYLLIFSFLFFLVYYSIIIDEYDPYIEVLSPLFIIMLSVISNIIFYFPKERIHYFFVLTVLIANMLLYSRVYDYYFPQISITQGWGSVYFEVLFGFLSVFIVVNIIVYYIQKKYEIAQAKLYKSNKEIKHYNIELEGKNEELKELKSELIAQNEELKVLDSTKDMFLSVISHDLKNSFNIVNGFSEILDTDYDTYDNTKRKYFIKEINISSNLIYNLLENLLNWSNIKLNGIDSSIETIIIDEFITETIETYNIIAKTKNISIICENIPSKKIKVDKYVITTVLGNFINNAIKFSHVNSKIEIFTTITDKAIKFTVKDYGVGIDENTKAKLFKIGTNISTKGTNEERGTGLGLILCNEIILKSDGKIWVESEINKGSSFSFSIRAHTQIT